MNSLNGKKALVTGGGQGIGHAIAAELIAQGCDVAIHYFSSREGAEELVATATTQRVQSFQADLTKEPEATGLVRRATEFLGGLDILINNVGDMVARRALEAMDEAFWDSVQSINVESLVWVTKAAVPHMAGKPSGASIVNLSSISGRKGGSAGSLAYSAAKGAILAWTRALASELGSSGIRVNAVTPGFILGTKFHATHTTEEGARKAIAQIPLGRAGTPQDVARAVAYLASEYNGFLNGATLDINGGSYCA